MPPTYDETLPDSAQEVPEGPTTEPGTEPSAGVVVAGRFALRAEIGRGAMGTVWRARHQGLEADVALKLISPDMLNRRSTLERFYREAKTLAKINHPNVVRVLDVALPADPVPYLAMELLEGEDLREHFERQGALEPDEATYIVAELVKGLAAAHAAGVVHRDLKPANISLARDAQAPFGYRVVVVDFGTALLLDGLDKRLTQTGIVVGTPMYMSPEQAVGEVPSAASDLYAAAVILYELLTEHVPHEIDDFRALLGRRSTQAAAPIRELRPELPGAYDVFFRRALAVDPEQRFADANAFGEALEALRQRKVHGFDTAEFSEALDAAVDDGSAPPVEAPGPAPGAGLDLVAGPEVQAKGPPRLSAEMSVTHTIIAPGEALGQPDAALSSLAGIELDYEAAGLVPPEDLPPAGLAANPGRSLFRSLASLGIASVVAYFAWVLLGGAPNFESFESGPMIEAAFAWVIVFIVAVVAFSSAAQAVAPPDAIVRGLGLDAAATGAQPDPAADARSDSPGA